MDSSFVTVFDIAEQGYRSLGWLLLLLACLLLTLVYWACLRPDSKGERIYKWVIAVLWFLSSCAVAAYHYRTYGYYHKLMHALANGQAEITTGHITQLWPEGYFLFIDVNDKRLRSSSSEWPFFLGYHPGDFALQSTFLVRISSVDDVIVKVELHRVHIE